MSLEMALPGRERARSMGWRRRTSVRIAVASAHVASRLAPRRLESIARLLAVSARSSTRYEDAMRVHQHVVAVSPRCAGLRGCLPRSIAIAILCRSEGTWPTWCIGVRRAPPFIAHAWIQSEGRLVGEPGSPDTYQPLVAVSHDAPRAR